MAALLLVAGERPGFVIAKKVPTRAVLVLQSHVCPADDHIRNVFSKELMISKIRMD